MLALLAKDPFQWTDPHTWPAPVWIWVAMLAGSWLWQLWKWQRKQQQASWPSTFGRVGVADVTTPTGLNAFVSNGKKFYGEIHYEYSAEGQKCVGHYQRLFGNEEEALVFVHGLSGRMVTVNYNPRQPSESVLLEDSVEALLQNRTPDARLEAAARKATEVPDWVRPLLWPAIALAAFGFALSLYVNIGALRGETFPPIFWALHVGIFVIWAPAVAVGLRRAGGQNGGRDFWKKVLRGAPDWMRYGVYVVFAYAFLGEFLMGGITRSGRNPGAQWLGFSATWMVFYYSGLVILYAAASAEKRPDLSAGAGASQK